MIIDDIDFEQLFPRTKFRFDPNNQLIVVEKEVNEAREAVFESPERLLSECIDIIYSTFTLLYNEKYSNKQINQAIRDTIEKNKQRGYYEK